MPRLVRIGRPDNLLVVTPPAEGELRFSYGRWVRLRGDWMGYDLRWVDLVDSEVEADLSRANCQGLTSRRTDWTRAPAIPDVGDLRHSHDLMRGLLAIARRTLRGRKAKVVDAVTAFLTRPDAWDKDWWAVVSELKARGYTAADLWPLIDRIFGSYAFAIKELTWALGQGDFRPCSRVIELAIPHPDRGWEFIPTGEWSQPMLDAATAFDRWTLARESETFLDARYPEYAPWRCLWRHIWPPSDNLAESESWLDAGRLAKWDWWTP